MRQPTNHALPVYACFTMAFTWFQYGSAASVVVLVVLLADLLLKRRSRISLKGKVVVITGGSSGIGLASAKVRPPRAFGLKSKLVHHLRSRAWLVTCRQRHARVPRL